MATRKRKYARYPSYFGKLDCMGLFNVAEKHGMEVIQCYKIDMHVVAEVGLYGTSSQMKAVEAEWAEHGNTLKRGNRKLAFGVDLNRPREQWVSVVMARAKANAVSTKGSRVRRKIRGRTVRLPPGYRDLRADELPKTSDIAWNEGAEVFEPIDRAAIEYEGKRRFKEMAHLILRRV